MELTIPVITVICCLIGAIAIHREKRPAPTA